MAKEILRPIKTWVTSLFKEDSNPAIEHNYLNIPIRPHSDARCEMPIHFAFSCQKTNKISQPVLNALGGLGNIESYREIPNSRRIRLTLVNPTLIDNALLEELDVRMFIRIGKRIVHIIP